MDGFYFLDADNRGVGVTGKIKEEGVAKNLSLSLGRKRLSDITNQQTHLKSLNQDEKLRPYSFATKEYIEKLQRENITLRQLLQESTHVLQERNNLLELSGLELTKLRMNVQKLQQQNRLLAQANSQMTMERTLDKDRMRVMQHELGCRGALLAAKDMEIQMEEVEVKKKRRQKPCSVKESEDVTVEATGADGGGDTTNDTSEEINEEPVPDDDYGDAKPNRSRRSRIQSSGSSAVKEQVVAKEKPKNKRPCLRRQSARFNSDSVGHTKDFCDLEDARNPTSMLLDENMQDGALEVQVEPKEKDDKESDQVKGDHVQAHVGDNEEHKCHRSFRSRTQSLGSLDVKGQVTVKEKPEGKRRYTVMKSEERESSDEQCDDKRLNSRRVKSEPCEDVFETEDARFSIGSLSEKSSMQQVEVQVKEGKRRDTPGGIRTSLGGRPSRLAAGKVQSYKEIPLNIKMRRTE